MTGHTTRFLHRRTANVLTESPLKVFPNVWLNNIPEESGNYKTSLERTLPKSEERSPEKKVSSLKAKIATFDIQGNRGDLCALKLSENKLCYHLKLFKKQRHCLLRANSGFSLFFFN